MDSKNKLSCKNLPIKSNVSSTRSTPSSIPRTTPRATAARTGGYAVTTMKTMSWLSTPPVKQDKTKGRKPKAPLAVVIPFLGECAEFVEDPYWKSILTQCSYGKFPRGFMYRNTYLTFKRGARPERIQLPESPKEATKTIINFFQSTAGMRSELDTEREKRELTEEFTDEQLAEKNKWSEMSQKYRTQAINEFIDFISTGMKLNTIQKNKLTTIINLGFILGYFTSDHVLYTDGSISGIIGLAYNPETEEFIYDPTKINTKNFSKTKKKIVPQEVYMHPDFKPYFEKQVFINFLNIWISYISFLTKNSPKNTHLLTDDTPESTQESTQEIDEDSQDLK